MTEYEKQGLNDLGQFVVNAKFLGPAIMVMLFVVYIISGAYRGAKESAGYWLEDYNHLFGD